MLSKNIETIKHRKNFYRDCYRRALKVLYFSFLVVIILLLLLIFFGANRPEPSYYATSMNGKITQLKPLSEPNYGSKYLI